MISNVSSEGMCILLPKISVIVPVYNAEAYLGRCLDSLLGQTFREIEIICIDDGSKDNSLNVLEKYASINDNVKIISQENKGQSFARNRGVDIAKGKYVGFVDSDDWVDSDFFEVLYTAMEKTSADLIQSGYRKVGCKKERTFSEISAWAESRAERLKLLHNGFSCNKLFRRDLLENYQIRFPEGLIYEDLLFCVQAVLRAKSFQLIDYCGLNYFQNVFSTAHNPEKKEQRKNDAMKIAKKIMQIGRDNSFSQEEEETLKNIVAKHLVWEEFFDDELYVETYRQLLGDNILLKQKISKARKKRLFYFSWRKKKLVIFGISCWR